MKTTVELPDTLFRKAKAAAAAEEEQDSQGFLHRSSERPAKQDEPSSYRDTETVEGLHSGRALRHLHKENKRIERIIEEEFETIDEEEWR